MSDEVDRAERKVFAFFTYSDGRCKAVIDGKEYPCKSLREAIDIFNEVALFGDRKETDGV